MGTPYRLTQHDEQKLGELCNGILRLLPRAQPASGHWARQAIVPFEDRATSLREEDADIYFTLHDLFRELPGVADTQSEAASYALLGRVFGLSQRQSQNQNEETGRQKRLKQSVKAMLTDLLEEVHRTPEQTVYIPIAGLSFGPQMPELNAGPVTFRALTDKDLQSLRSIAAPKPDEADLDERVGRQQILNVLELWEKEHVAVAVCTVRAEPGLASERADRWVREGLALLNAAVPLHYSLSYQVIVSVHGELARGWVTDLVIDPSSAGLVMHDRRVGPHTTFDVNQTTLALLSERGILDALGALGTTPDPKLLDTHLFYALRWAGRAHMQRQDVDLAYLSLVSGLETLLGDKASATKAVTQGAAVLLGQTDEKRQVILKQMDRYYDKRSGITHGQRVEASAHEFRHLQSLLNELLTHVQTLRPELRTWKDFRNHVRALRALHFPDPTPQPTEPSS